MIDTGTKNGTGWNARAVTVGELARSVEGRLEGDPGALIVGVSSIEDARTGDIVFAENPRFLNKALKSNASAVISFLDAVTPDKPLIKVENPRYAFVKILEMFRPELNVHPGVHPTAVLGKGVHVGENASVGAHVTVGDNVRIGDGAVILPGCFIGDDCTIGRECILYANVTLYHGTLLGERVMIHSGAVIGADGFGYTQVGDRSYKVPQVGNVEIHDDVEIGACTTIDRAKTGSTVIGARTKIDNLVHIAHNCKTGTDCIVVAQVGVAGSTTIGNRVIIAGQAGVKDHITIHDDVVVMGQSAVFGDVEPKQVISGYPARDHRQKLRIQAAVDNLPETVKRLRALEKANEALTASNERLERLVEQMAARLGFSEDNPT
jgi:UDP-3-O-[3-hydroxymyristoyl] glucosamine N-acyltransferase